MVLTPPFVPFNAFLGPYSPPSPRLMPRHVNLFCALVGAGAHLCLVTLMLLICALIGAFRPTKRGSILTCIIVLYCITACVGGFMSARCVHMCSARLDSFGSVWFGPVRCALIFHFNIKPVGLRLRSNPGSTVSSGERAGCGTLWSHPSSSHCPCLEFSASLTPLPCTR